MKCFIRHEVPGRLRVHADIRRMSPEQADILEYYLRALDGVTDVKVYDRTCDAVICYAASGRRELFGLKEDGDRMADGEEDGDRMADGEEDRCVSGGYKCVGGNNSGYKCVGGNNSGYKEIRNNIVSALGRFAFDSEEALALAPDFTGRKTSRHYQEKLMMTVARRILNRVLLPAPFHAIVTAIRSVKYIVEGIRCLAQRKIEVSVLDATAIAVSMIRRDFATASSVMFLLDIGEILEEWTHKKSVDDLAMTMSLNVDKVWTRREGQEMLVSLSEIQVGDDIIVRQGNMIPLDGKVLEGEATVNQASMTGESIPVPKLPGSYIYAGTVVEEGQCILRVDKETGSGRYDRIVNMIEESEKLKSLTEDRASHLADKLVSYSLGGTLLTYLLTRNASKALAILMVDFSCALKLSMPVTVLSAMKEAQDYGITVKGGKFLEAVAQADTIVFDKTGTLTHARPKVVKVVSFGGSDENEMLRMAACLEEHYPHSMANAVVEEAKSRGLLHEEHHSKVEYVVAHGISSIVDDKKVIIGSYHFVFQDEGCVVPEGEEALFEELPDEYSLLYLAVSGRLAAVICIMDPLRSEASQVVQLLHELGLSRVVMMTGDSEKTAAAVAAKVGVDEYHSEVLPEDKADFVAREHEAGRTVIMIGDGINDSPALAEADAGIAISDGAAIAREIADITISADDLYSLVQLRRLSSKLMKRIDNNYRFIIGFNFMLILFGVTGILQPTTTALLHNTSTLGIGIYDMTRLLEDGES